MKEIMRCGSCGYFKGQTDNPSYGECKRFPPQLLSRLREADKYAGPPVSDKNWCGEWSEVAQPTVVRKS